MNHNKHLPTKRATQLKLFKTTCVSLFNFSLLLVLIVCGTVTKGCSQTDPEPVNEEQSSPESNPQDSSFTLLFKSGFEPGTFGTPDSGRITDIKGTDESTGLSWESDLEAECRRFFVNYADASDGDSNPDMLGANIVKDPADINNTVFYAWQNDAEYGKWYARVQGEIDHLNYSDVVYKVRIKVDSAIAILNEHPDWNFWLMLNELKVDNDRASLRWTRDDQSGLVVWAIHHRIGDDIHLEKSATPVKFGTWQTIEMHVKGGKTDSGFSLKIEGNLAVEDAVPLNARNGARWNDFDILKVYGSAVDVITDPAKGNKDCFKVWYDDLEIWVK